MKQLKIYLSIFKINYQQLFTNQDIYAFCQTGAREVIIIFYSKKRGYTNKLFIMGGGKEKKLLKIY